MLEAAYGSVILLPIVPGCLSRERNTGNVSTSRIRDRNGGTATLACRPDRYHMQLAELSVRASQGCAVDNDVELLVVERHQAGDRGDGG